jgi:hypothetical protein
MTYERQNPSVHDAESPVWPPTPQSEAIGPVTYPTYGGITTTTKNWAVSAIVLGTLVLLLTAGGMIWTAIMSHMNLPNQPHLSPAFQAINWIIQGLSILTSIGFIVGGAATTRGKASGPETLSYMAVAAIVIILFSTCYQVVMMNSAAYKLAIAKALAMSPNGAQMIHTIQAATAICMVVIVVIELAYNIGLYLHMSKR